ncbi:Sister chromatid cohesion protein PDS5 like protein B [Fukomys damarensis]|uniref:Sister chromatid cohesion protein PDS5 like protein B n=1 Tax=Fukomys damarensis TaxID=885580 RepID=A0A091DMK0_FUKDA|nr:Sister chromatid cohesion protein PDS5 like protein B [Fukomys damarensis]
MAHSKTRTNDGKITYPPGVKEISDKISKEEMVRRLKMVVKTFMDMDQDSEEEKELYLNLALHLASDFFLKHPDKDVRLLVACCLADIFRIYAPEAPYTSPDKLKASQYTSVILSTKCVLNFSNGHNQKVHMHMVDLMSSIICEGDTVSQELLDTVLVNLVPAHKFFNQVLMLGKTSISDLSEHVFDLILELYNIDSHLLLSVLPQLEFKLKSNDNEERLQVVKLLAKMFGAKDSELASQNKPLWQCYLGRFNDIHVPIRLECVKFASHCLMNHPDLAKDLTEYLKVRSHDPEEAIRHDVIVSIVTAAKKDILLVNDHLLNFVRERTLDKRWRVRKEAMMGLAQIYKKYALQSAAGKDAAKQISWIKDKLLHIYYQNSIDDRLLVERIFAQYMVPHNLETTERMKCLYYLYATLDLNAVKALNEMWKCQNLLRHQVKDLLDLIKQPKTDASVKAIFSKVMVITRNLPDPGKAQDFMKKFTQVLEDDEKIRKQLEVLVSPTCSCKQAEGCVQVNKSIDGTADDEDEGVPTDQAIRAGLELLKVLSFTHPISFHSAETFESLLACLKMDDEKVAEAALQIFKNTGSKIEEDFPHIRSALLPVLHHKSKKGPPRQAKYAIHCIHAIFSSKETQFAQIFEPLHKSLDPSNLEHLITPLVTIGHIALLAPDQFAAPLKSLVATFIVKDLLMNDRIQAIKMMVRWLLGMKNNHSKSGTSTLRLLTTILHSDGDLTEQGKISKPDMSRLRLAAGSAIVKLAQEPCYHEIITLEQYQLCALAINDECYQVRQVFAQKLHKGLSRLRLPLEYMAICALCAKDPVKERRAHARQCLVKNINVRREYLKQHAAVSEKLLSLLPEYVVPYTIHLLAHDPDYVKVQDIEQLKDVKELDSSEMDHSENEDYTMSSPLPGKKSDKRDDSDLVRSELEKPRSRKKTPITDSEDKLGVDDLNKLVQEQKPKGSQRSRKRGHTVSESDEQQWPEEKRLKEDMLENEDEQNSPPKKGKRGRPPKPLGGGAPKEEPTMKTSKKGNKKKSGPSVVEEEEEEERQSGNTEQKSKSKQHRTSRRAQQSRVGRSKQAATKENDSSEEVDVFQGSSPVNDDIPQEETEEEEVSTVNVRRRSSKRERR